MMTHDSLRQILQREEALRRIFDPLGDFRRLIEPLIDASDHLDASSGAVGLLQQEQLRRRLLSGFAGALGDGDAIARMVEDVEGHRRLLESLADETRRSGLLDPQSDLRRSIAAAIEARQSYEQMFGRPELDGVARLAREAMSSSTLVESAFSDPTLLESAMAQMRNPWLNVEDVNRSAWAFAEIQAIGRTLNERPPFESELSAALRPSLGDWRDLITPSLDTLSSAVLRSGFYAERGLDTALTDFPVPAFEECINAAGLQERPAETPGTDEAEEDEDDGGGFARARVAFDRLQQFEIAIRAFIEKAMKGAFNEDWTKHQLPSGMLDEWQTKRDAAQTVGEENRPLINYADFTDYRKIIERRDNWTTVFKPIFGRSDDVRESLQRLYPVRIATMHARIVTLDDELLLLVETKRVLRAMRG